MTSFVGLVVPPTLFTCFVIYLRLSSPVRVGSSPSPVRVGNSPSLAAKSYVFDSTVPANSYVFDSTVPCLAVIAYAQPTKLKRTLQRLNMLDYGPDDGHVRLTISIDKPADDALEEEEVQTAWQESVSIASAFEFHHGRTVIDVASSHRGRLHQWVDAAWSPDLDLRPACMILEEGIVPSTYVWRWMRKALNMRSKDDDKAASLWPRVASLSLEVPALMPAQSHVNGQPFLHKLMSTGGVVAFRQHWINFQAFMRVRFAPKYFKRIWSRGESQSPSNAWPYWFDLFAEERNLFTLYPNLETKAWLNSSLAVEAHLSASLDSFSWFDWNTTAVSVEMLKPKTDCVFAISALATKFTDELRVFLQSVQHFQKGVPIYIAANSDVMRKVAAAFPNSQFVVHSVLDHYGSLGRGAMEQRGMWEQFMMEKVTPMRWALNDGCKGVWYFDNDQRLLAPLPTMENVHVGLTPHRIRITKFGLYNGGCIYASRYEPLDLWEAMTHRKRGPHCCFDQVALDLVAEGSSWKNPGDGVNIGVFEMGVLSPNLKNNLPQLKCRDGKIKYGEIEVVTLHFHPTDPLGRPLMPYLNRAIKECGYPSWLAER